LDANLRKVTDNLTPNAPSPELELLVDADGILGSGLPMVLNASAILRPMMGSSLEMMEDMIFA
jgi:hypothetical protein